MLVSKLKAKEERVLWMGVEGSEVALIHSRRAGVVLRGIPWRGGLKRDSRSGLGRG